MQPVLASIGALAAGLGLGWLEAVAAPADRPAPSRLPLSFIHTSFENASPRQWRVV